ncbi:hypothetical protein V6N13_004161 [Hibiscus sabdariffa]
MELSWRRGSAAVDGSRPVSNPSIPTTIAVSAVDDDVSTTTAGCSAGSSTFWLAPQPVPPPTQMQQYSAGSAAAGSGEVRSLWIGDLQPWMDENYLISIFSQTGEVVSAKVIRNKLTALPEGYGFIEFVSRVAAERVLQSYNGVPMPNAEQNFRLNWASLGSGEKRQDEGPDYTIFVGDLAADVSDYMLQETFKAVYPSVKGAKVVNDRTTGRSKGQCGLDQLLIRSLSLVSSIRKDTERLSFWGAWK